MGCQPSCLAYENKVHELSNVVTGTTYRPRDTNYTAAADVTGEHQPQTIPLPSTISSTEFETSLQGQDGIAIVGIGCRTPGADNIDEFWRVLKNGECHISDVPTNRWNADAFLDSDPNAFCKAYVQKGGFIKDVESFDNTLYGINDFEATQMDPQQFLLLDCATMAMQDGGFTRQQLAGSGTGVFIGGMNIDYSSAYFGRTSKVNTYTSTGISSTILASRLSYVFDLHGPCMVVDTACSASLVAIHQACQAIRSGDCDMALCGGANCILSPDTFVKLSKARMISPTGLCHTFSNEADGYTRGEGCGVIILKRLKDALRDGDKVWATINTGTNQDGRTVTPMTAPSGEQQKKLLHAIYNKWQVDVSQLDYIEAHGTGTPAGDPVEVNALGSFVKERSDGQTRSRYIGSVKTNIGHTEAAAGVLGLIKILLMMKHNTIVPSLHCKTVNPKIDLQNWHFVIPKQLVPWDSHEKLAACNSFGFGGSNAHAVIQSFTYPNEVQNSNNTSQFSIVCFSGKTQERLKGSMEDLYADAHVPLLHVMDIAYTSTVHRDHFSYREAFVVQDMSGLLNIVGEKLSMDKWSPPSTVQTNVVFVFCGMGTAWEGMCRQLLQDVPVFRETVKEIESHLQFHVSWSLIQRLQQENPCDDPILSPLAIFACQVGLDAVWKSLGVHPYSVVGQSVGEVAAAYSAGCISLEDAVTIMYHRSRLLAEVSGGKMIVVQNVDVEKVRHVLDQASSRTAASIALEYSPRACAISADSETMLKLRPLLLSELKAGHRDMQLIDLDVQVAYHSPLVTTAADKLKEKISSVKSYTPNTTFVSTVTGKIVSKPLLPEHWEDNIKKPVLFHQAMLASATSKSVSNTVFLEIGPRPILRTHLSDLFPGNHCKSIPSVMKPSETKKLNQAVASLYECGINFKWDRLQTQSTTLTDVPRCIFQRKNIREKTEEEIIFAGGCNMLKKNHLFVFPVEGPVVSHKLVLSPLTLSSVYQHHVSGSIVVPGALYAEVGFAVARYSRLPNHVTVSLDFQQLLVLETDQVVDADIVSDTAADSDEPWVNGRVYLVKRAGKQLAKIICQVSDAGDFQREPVNVALLRSKCTERVSKSSIYLFLKNSGFEYGESFSLLESGLRNAVECLVTLEINAFVNSEMADMTIHPCILDCCLQAVSLLAHNKEVNNTKMLPKNIGSIAVFRNMEKIMYVHAKLRSKDNRLEKFDIKLLSPEGHVIADIFDFTVQIFASQEIAQAPDILSEHWNKVKDLFPDSVPLQRKMDILVICETATEVKHTTSSGTIHMKYDRSTQVDSFKDELSRNLKKTPIEALVFISPQSETDRMASDSREAEAIQASLIQLCLLIQSLGDTVNKLSPNTPVYVLTFNAFPKVLVGKPEIDVNPSARALWGLIRTAVTEHAFSEIIAVELHVTTHITDGFLFSLLEVLRDEKVKGFPEVMVTDNAVYVNQVATATSSTLIPQLGSTITIKANDINGDMILVSKDSLNLTKLQAANHFRSLPPDAYQTSMRVEAFVQPHQKLMNSKIYYECMTGKAKTEAEYLVMAIEVCGVSIDGAGLKLASCCPLPVGPQVLVPKETTLQTSCIPQYQVGDLCKLILLWCLKDKASTKQCTILASKETFHLAQVVKTFSCDFSKASDSINIVMFEELQNECFFGSCLLSLVLVDVEMMTMITKYWKQSDTFVTCSCLVNSDVQTFVSCVLPHTDFELIDTQLLFQQKQLREIVPRIKEWINKNTASMSEISKYLHTEITNDSNGNTIKTLFQFRSAKMSDLSVTFKKDSIFIKTGIYLVVGGLTGLGWLCVEFLAKNQAGYIAIINRRSPSDEQTANINNLMHKFNNNIKAFQADISDKGSMERAIQQITKDWVRDGQLRGVFTGAAVLDDRPFHIMDRAAFETVLTPKVKGTWNLHLLTKHLPLDFFVMHSSVASVLGNQGQANYSAANAFMDGLAFHRAHHGLAAQTINWGPLDTGLLDNQDAMKKKLETMGFSLASQEDIKETLRVLLQINPTQAIPVTLNKELYAIKMRNAAVTAMLKRFKYLLAVNAGDIEGDNTALQTVDKIRFLENPQRLQQYEEYVRRLTVRILSVDAMQVTRHVNLFALGMDSVTGTMLLNIIERQTGFTLSAIVVFASNVTVESLAQALDDRAGTQTSK